MKFSLYPPLTLLLFLISGTNIQAQDNLLDLYYSGKYDEILTTAAASISSGDTAFNTYYLKALSEIQLGQTREAISTLEQAQQLHSDNVLIHKMLARQYFEAGAYLKANDYLSDLVRADSTDVSSWLKLADIASFRQQYDEAVEALNRVLAIDSRNLNSLMKMGDILDRHNHTGAVLYYERAYRFYPENQKAAYALANQYIQIKKARNAIPVCENMLVLDSTSIKFRKLIGYAYYKTGEPHPAVKHFKLATARGDLSVFTFKYMGISQYLAVDYAGAVESLQTALKKDSLDAEVHFVLGTSLSTTYAKKEATYHLEKSLELMQPESSIVGRIYSELGYIKRQETAYEEAYSFYAQAWETDTNPMYLYYMASVLDNSMHRSKEALEVYQQYVNVVNRMGLEGTRDKHVISIFTIVVDRIESLNEELFFLDEK